MLGPVSPEFYAGSIKFGKNRNVKLWHLACSYVTSLSRLVFDLPCGSWLSINLTRGHPLDTVEGLEPVHTDDEPANAAEAGAATAPNERIIVISFWS